MKKIIINKGYFYVRTAVVENGRLQELYLDPKNTKAAYGDIYIGRVENLLESIQAAFINIGEEKNVYYSYKDKEKPKIGAEFPVQVIKESTGHKGAVVRRNINISGRYLVLLPYEKDIFVSRKITADEKRQSLQEALLGKTPPDMGIIVRTQAKEAGIEAVEKELAQLLSLWEKIKKSMYIKAPACIYKEPTGAQKAVKDLVTDDVDEIIVDDEGDYAVLKGYFPERARLHKGKAIFMEYFLESQIEKALRKKVWLKSGGFVVFEQTEALVVIDVNSGKYTDGKNVRKTIRKINLEAAEKIAEQIRLRNLFGIIIIDFIDMEWEEDKNEVLDVLEEAVRHDKVQTTCMGITSLGLVQMTRKKTRPSLMQMVGQRCAYCQGEGVMQNFSYTNVQIESKIKEMFETSICDHAELLVSEQMKGFMEKNGVAAYLQDRYGKVDIIAAETMKQHHFSLKPVMSHGIQ